MPIQPFTPEDQPYADLAFYAKELSAKYADKQRKAGRRQRLDAMDFVEVLHAIARYMVLHGD